MHWRPGEVVVHQEVWKDRVWAARPFTVVEDDGERLLLWMPRGTRRKVPMTPPSRRDPATLDDRIIELLARRDWVYVDHLWLRRTPLGFRAMDLLLDVVVEPDLRWRWKDEEQFRRIIELGIFDEGTVARVRSEGRSIIERIVCVSSWSWGESNPRRGVDFREPGCRLSADADVELHDQLPRSRARA